MDPFEEKMKQGGEPGLRQASLFFMRDDPVHQTLREIARRLGELQIPYAVVVGMALVAALLAIAAPVTAQSGPTNLDFEDGETNGMPTGWFMPTAGYEIKLLTDNPKNGKTCARLSSMAGPSRAPFGNILQTIDATPFRGKRVKFQAAVRTDVGPPNKAQLWFRVDRPDRKMGFFDNMGDRPITDGRWKYYRIEGDIDDDAQQIVFGCMLIRQGSVYLDDVTLEIIADAQKAPVEPPAPLEGRALDNLVAFTKLLGYVRYFHPSDEVEEANWNEFALAGVRSVEKCKSSKQLAGTLEELFQPIAPTVQLFRTGHPPKPAKALLLPKDVRRPRIRKWVHLGVGLAQQESIYRSSRETGHVRDGKIPEGFADPADTFKAELGRGVSCSVPLALYADSHGTLPKSKNPPKTDAEFKTLSDYSAEDRATRLAAVAITWNVFQHFYPYFDVVKTDWDAALRSALTKAAMDADERAFLETLRELVAQLHDGHGNVTHRVDYVPNSLPLGLTWVGEKLVVTVVSDGVSEIAPGDVVRSIDGTPAVDLYDRAARSISAATPQWKRWKALGFLARVPNGGEVELAIEKPDGTRHVQRLESVALEESIHEQRPAAVDEVKPGVYYVDTDRVSDAEFNEALPLLAEAKGIVFDFRGYPKKLNAMAFFSHIVKKPVVSPQWHIPIVERPDRQDMRFEQPGGWHISPSEPYLAAPKAFIIDGRAISYAESCLGIIEHYKLGELVGGPTAGTNGNVNPFSLMGGYYITWTGMKVLKHDGSQHHGVGILPTVPVSRTIKGIAEGRDELLERASEVVSSASSRGD